MPRSYSKTPASVGKAEDYGRALDGALPVRGTYHAMECWVFLIGFMQGLAVTAASEEPCFEAQVRAKRHFYSRLSLGEMRNEGDSFYEVEVNGSLPVTLAIQYAAKKANGATGNELDELLAGTRKAAERNR